MVMVFTKVRMAVRVGKTWDSKTRSTSLKLLFIHPIQILYMRVHTDLFGMRAVIAEYTSQLTEVQPGLT